MNERVRSLIMAGGKSERMLASGEPTHKALVRVRGLTLLEWNVRTLLHFGFSDIIVAVSTSNDYLGEFCESLTPIVNHAGGALSVYREPAPLGNVGAAREVVGDAELVLMLYVDNLSAIDLRSLVSFHQDGASALTIATHVQSFQIPFGKLTVEGERIVRYEEKPFFPLQVSSGTCVLSRTACERLPPGRQTGASDLCRMLLEDGERVAAFRHDSAWIDINDAATLRQAEVLVGRHWAAFEAMQQ